MANVIDNQPAWLLHSRPFRDTSLLLDFLTPDHGRVSAIARGARSGRPATRALLQPFHPLSISLAGRSELLNLRLVEARGPARPLLGERLFAALYINELMVRLLPGQESETELFDAYALVLQELAGTAELEPLLRSFELRLLDALGYGLQFTHEADNNEAIAEDGWYYLREDSGFVRQLQVQQMQQRSAASQLYPGRELQLIAAENFAAQSTRQYAKRLLRQVLQQHLSAKPLTSRELFL
jgi:DNA repair protein RecO (recombination protein O)